MQFAPAPTQLIYWLLATLFIVCIAGAAFLPDAGRPDGKWLRALVPLRRIYWPWRKGEVVG